MTFFARRRNQLIQQFLNSFENQNFLFSPGVQVKEECGFLAFSSANSLAATADSDFSQG